MSSDEARAIVQDGLRMRKFRREQAAKEARLEEYEQEMISACNAHCEGAKRLRIKSEKESQGRVQLVEQRRYQRQQMLKKMERDARAVNAVRTYAFVCLVIMLVTVWTPFPWWAAVALTAGLAVCNAAYIFRLYVPWEECCEYNR